MKRLRAAWKQDAEGVLRLARALLEVEGAQPAKRVIARLMTGDDPSDDGGSIMIATDPPTERPAREPLLVEVQATSPDSVTLKVNTRLPGSVREDLVRYIERFLRTRNNRT